MDNRLWDICFMKGISEESKKKIAQIETKTRTYEANELILADGEEIRDIGMILKGVIKSTEYTKNGKELNSSYFFGGDAFPFYLIYGGVKRYFFNTYCLKKASLIWVPVDQIMPIVHSDPIFMQNILVFVSKYTVYSKMNLRMVQYRKISDRLSYWLIHMNDPSQRIKIPNSQGVLADILHVSRSSLNQEFKKLQQAGILKLEGKYIHIQDESYLRKNL